MRIATHFVATAVPERDELIVDTLHSVRSALVSAGHTHASRDEEPSVAVVVMMRLPPDYETFQMPSVQISLMEASDSHYATIYPVGLGGESACIGVGLDSTIAVVLEMLDRLTQRVALRKLRPAVEVFAFEWDRLIKLLDFETQDLVVGSALADLAAEIVKTDAPPIGVIRAAFSWFWGRFDTFVEEAAGAMGKGLGVAAGTGSGLLVTGQLSKVEVALAKVIAAL
jgi:hypothetical protein